MPAWNLYMYVMIYVLFHYIYKDLYMQLNDVLTWKEQEGWEDYKWHIMLI